LFKFFQQLGWLESVLSNRLWAAFEIVSAWEILAERARNEISYW